MTIDEAIAREREIAEEQRIDNENCEYKAEYGCKGCADYYSKPCIECTEEHEQLAEWLEELKSYRASVFSGYMTQKMLKEEYNKAIDDLLGGMNQITYNCQDADELFEKICDLAEQLKAGGEMEYKIADARNPNMGLNNKPCKNPKYWCRLHQVWLSEKDVERKHCKSKITIDMISTRLCTNLVRKEFK